MSADPINAATGLNTTSFGIQPASVSRGVIVRLSLMFLLNFIVFGAWYATLGLVLATHGMATIIGLAFAGGALAGMVSPLFLGAIGDRFLSSQIVLAIAHAIGGVLLLFMPGIVNSGNGWYAVVGVFVYMLFFQPTLGLINNIAFRHLGNSRKLFPYVRVFATLGWIVAGLGVGALGLSASTGVFVVASIASFVLAAYSLTLPKTPPTARGARFSIGDIVGAKAFVLFRNRNFAIFALCSLLTTISLGIYNAYASTFIGALGVKNVAGVLTIGQISEIVFILTIPFVLAKLGMKVGLLAGMGMWAVRFTLFAIAIHTDAWVAVLAIALHGICNDFFLILGAMYIDRVTPGGVSAQAQSLFVWISSGAGIFVGALIGNTIFGATVGSNPQDVTAWGAVWIVPGCIALATALVWSLFFRQSRSEDSVVIDSGARATV